MPGLLAPLFLLGALAAAVPIVLHLLKREPEARVKFPAVRLLQLAPIEQTSRRRLREWLLLALRVTAIVLLSVAFARPFLAREAGAGSDGLLVVALDTSFSLSAPARFDAARELAHAAISRARAGDLIAVVTFDDEARVTAAPTADRPRLAAAIDAAQPGFGATRYRAAIAAAAGLFEERGRAAGTIVVVTDLQASGWSADDAVAIPEGVRLELADVGPLVSNLAVTDARVVAGGLRATVRNLTAESRDVRLLLTVDEASAGEAVLSLGPNETGGTVLAVADAGRTAKVQIVDPDGLQADNARFVVLRGQPATPVLVVTASGDLDRDAFYVHQALLASGPSGAAHAVEGVGADALSGWPVTQFHDYAAVVVLSTRGLDRRGRDTLREYAMRGGRLFVAAGPGVDGDVVAGALDRGVQITVPVAAASDPRGERRALAPVDMRHPVFRTLGGGGSAAATVGLATFRRIAGVAAARCDLLARFTTGEAALVECAADGGRTLVLASDLNHEWNDLPRHGAFVPFLHEVVNYLSEGRRWAREYGVEDVPEGNPRSPGFLTLPAVRPGNDPRLVAVNVDPAESEPDRLTPEAFLAAVSPTAAPPGGGESAVERMEPPGQQAWRYVLLLLVTVLALESVLGRRTA